MAFFHAPAVPPKTRRITCFGWSEDGLTIAAGRGDGVVELWDKNEGRKLRELNVHTAEVRQIHLGASGRLIIARGWPNLLMTLESASGSRIEVIDGRNASITADGHHLLLVDQEDGVVVRDLRSNQPGVGRRIAEGEIAWTKLSSDRRWLVTGTSRGVCHVWSLPGGEIVFSGRCQIRGLIRVVTPGLYALIEDGADLSVVDLRSGQPVQRLDGAPRERKWVVASLDGRYVLIGSDTCLRLWRLGSEDSSTITRQRRLPSSSLRYVAFMDDDRFVLTAGLDARLEVWSAHTGLLAACFAADSPILSAMSLDTLVAIGTDLGFVHLLRLEDLPGRSN